MEIQTKNSNNNRGKILGKLKYIFDLTKITLKIIFSLISYLVEI